MTKEELLQDQDNKWLFIQFLKINDTAKEIYGAIQGGVDMNFFACYKEFESGIFGWVKEKNAFETSVSIYELYTSNDGWDVINQLEDIFNLEHISFEEITRLRNLIEE